MESATKPIVIFSPSSERSGTIDGIQWEIFYGGGGLVVQFNNRCDQFYIDDRKGEALKELIVNCYLKPGY
jgi:hypothetical protein